MERMAFFFTSVLVVYGLSMEKCPQYILLQILIGIADCCRCKDDAKMTRNDSTVQISSGIYAERLDGWNSTH